MHLNILYDENYISYKLQWLQLKTANNYLFRCSNVTGTTVCVLTEVTVTRWLATTDLHVSIPVTFLDRDVIP